MMESLYYKSFLLRGIGLILLWLVLTSADRSALWLGVPISLLATFISLKLIQPTMCSLPKLLYFLAFFIWNSFKGSVDVASRAFSPQMRILPGMLLYKINLTTTPARIFMTNVVSLMPGTLIAEIDNEYLRVHVIDESRANHLDLEKLEQLVSGIFNDVVVK